MLDNTFGPLRFSMVANVGSGYDPNVGRITIERNVMNGPLVTCRPLVFVETYNGVFRTAYTVRDDPCWRTATRSTSSASGRSPSPATP